MNNQNGKSIQRSRHSHRKGKHTSASRRMRLGIEVLEDRRLLAVEIAPLLDINSTTSPFGSSIRNIMEVGGVTYFSASSATTGEELWKSNGTSAGTVLVKDIYSGMSGSSPRNLTEVNGTLYFTASNQLNGEELWKTDGTTAGTVMVKDIQPGQYGSRPSQLTNVSGTLYFRADNGSTGYELWKSNGTSSGTTLVKDIRAGSYSSNLSGFVNLNGKLYFQANDGVSGSELWRSNGTPAGTVLVKDIRAGNYGSSPSGLTKVNNTLYFTASDGVNGDELWKSDGTSSGTTFVKDIRTGVYSSNAYFLTNVNGTLYFSADDGISGPELWKSNGTSVGTVIVKDIGPGSYGAYPNSLTSVNGTLYFRSRNDIWKSDGTPVGTVKLKEGGFTDGNNLTNSNGVLYFTANDGVNGTELWKSNGTDAGTNMIKDIFTGSDSSNPSYLSNVNGTLYFLANNGIIGDELWKSNGTAAGTKLVKDINGGTNKSNASGVVDVLGIQYFTASDGVHGEELWKTNGTAAGTVLVKDIFPGTYGSNIHNLTNVNGTLFFTATDGVNGEELWKSNGTSAGTVLLKDILEGSFGSNIGNLTSFNGKLFFSAQDNIHGYELWSSDGTEAGTALFKDLNPDVQSSFPSRLYNANGTLYFKASDSLASGLWKSDGTPDGTVLFSQDTDVTSDFYDIGGILYFRGRDREHGYELWRTDGTGLGTMLVKDVAATRYGGISNLTNANGTLYFKADDEVHGYELWKSDGTELGTVLVKDILPGPRGSNISYLTNVNGTLFFQANDNISGYELWKSDGSNAGTILVKDIVPGLTSTRVRNLANAGGTLYFQANDGVIGDELWKSDGTPAGTVPFRDIAAGGSDPSNLVSVRNKLFFTASTDTFGRELYVLTINQPPIAAPDVLSSVAEDSGPRWIPFTSLTSNDTPGPAEEAGQSLTLLAVSNPVGGTVTLSWNGIVFKPSENFNGIASFDYTIRDNGASDGVNDFKTAVGHVSFAVNQVNDRGTFGGILSGTQVEGSGSITGVATFIDEKDGFSAPNFNLSQAATYGNASIMQNGTWTYSPNADFNGNDSFIVSVTDDDGNVESKVINVTITKLYVSINGTNATDDFVFTISSTFIAASKNGGVATNYPLGAIFTVQGNAGTDTLRILGDTVFTDWALPQTNSGYANIRSKTYPQFFFFSVENLIGSDLAPDRFRISGNANLGGTINGGTGANDRIDISDLNGATTVNLESKTATGIQMGWIAVEEFKATNGTFVGANSNSSWNLINLGTGTVTSGAETKSFSGFRNLMGGTADDSFEMLADGQVTGTLHGGAGANSLSYATRSSPVNVSFGNNLYATSINNLTDTFSIVIGGDGNDMLAGSATRGMVLVGNGGNDTIIGGEMQDILIGGLGSDILRGGSGEDILVGGRLTFDQDINGLRAILREWQTLGGYSQRVSNLRGTTASSLNPIYYLRNSNVAAEDTLADDSTIDTLFGGANSDWFIAGADDLTPDWNALLERKDTP